MKIYEIPVYTSETNLKELDLYGTIYCYKSVIGVKEIVTHDIITILDNDMLKRIGTKEYMKDTSTLHNYYHNKTLKSEGIVPYVLRKDCNMAKEVSKEDVKDYIENFEQSSYTLLRKEGKENIKHKNMLSSRK